MSPKDLKRQKNKELWKQAQEQATKEGYGVGEWADRVQEIFKELKSKIDKN